MTRLDEIDRSATTRKPADGETPRVGLLGEPISEAGLARRERQRAATRADGRGEPLRPRVLAALADGTTRPSLIAEAVGSTREEVSRVLADLRRRGLVERSTSEADRRRRLYVLTAEGEVQLSRHLAFGRKPEPARMLDEKESRKLAEDGLARAVRLRRESNELEEARDRLRAVIREAERIGGPELALDARAELAKTLRQANEYEAMDALIDELGTISLGGVPEYDATFVLPAAAHHRYALGRAGDRRGDRLAARARHLAIAGSIYGQLSESSGSKRRARHWRTYEAWSVLSLAGNMRKRTEPVRAIRFAAAAKETFDLLEDDYGRVHCLFMFGFCLRLLGEFKESWTCLRQAHDLAVRSSFDRARAETLMQMGEVCRCQLENEEARAHLDEAIELAGRMHLEVTHAFASSSLGAVEFQEHRPEVAQELLTSAQEIFELVDHRQDRALIAQRQAAAARMIATDSSRPNYAAIERWISGAEDQYRDLRSPAGLAACQIENGRVRMMRSGGRVGPVIKVLGGLLEDDRARKTIELDPWVPLLLRDFAGRTGVPEFGELAGKVYSDSLGRLARDAEEGLGLVSSVMKDLAIEEEDESDPLVAEMGSETRRQLSAGERESLLPREFGAAEAVPALSA